MTRDLRCQIYALKSSRNSYRSIANPLSINVAPNSKGYLLSYVDRASKYSILAKLDFKKADLVIQATKHHLKKIPHPIQTITYDNDKEFAAHE